VLVVDDNEDAADSLAALLQLSGHEVFVAYDGQQALEVAEQVRPDVVLLDVSMPRMDGHEVARRLRRSRLGQVDLHRRIVGLRTGAGSRAFARRGLQCTPDKAGSADRPR
jgi:CheY-like chemotaxis protein